MRPANGLSAFLRLPFYILFVLFCGATLAEPFKLYINKSVDPNNVILIENELSALVTHTTEGLELELPGVDVNVICRSTQHDGTHDRCTLTLESGPISPTDTDGDTIPDNIDNCPSVSNYNQTDTDGDGEGNACDSDDDGDGVPDSQDSCPTQAASTSDGCPVTVNNDTDGDGVLNNDDNCPDVANSNQANNDGDQFGDACDTDDDNDGVLDSQDSCPTQAASTSNGCPTGTTTCTNTGSIECGSIGFGNLESGANGELITIRRGKTLVHRIRNDSTLNSSSVSWVRTSLQNSTPTNGAGLRAWISETPGGTDTPTGVCGKVNNLETSVRYAYSGANQFQCALQSGKTYFMNWKVCVSSNSDQFCSQATDNADVDTRLYVSG